MIETRLLHYFLAVAREESITRAAESLYITQSTLSRQMMELEQQLGKQLFLRGKRKITLTEDGVFFRSRAQEILELMENTETALRSDTERLTGDITIGCGETIAMDLFAELFAEFHRRYPEVVFNIHSGDADMELERLDKGLADMGLLLGPVRREKYDYWNLRKKDIYGLLIPRDDPLAAQERINIDQLKTLPLIMSKRTFSGHHQMDWFGTDPTVLHIVATYNLIHNATYLVERGIGYALSIDRLVNTEGRNLVFRPITPQLSTDLYLVTKKHQVFSPAVKQFLHMVKEGIMPDTGGENGR